MEYSLNFYWNISSALVSPASSEALLNALSTCKDPGNYKLPQYQEPGMEFDAGEFQLQGWIDRPDEFKGNDTFDPHSGDIDYPEY